MKKMGTHALSVALLLLYALVFMEWLFFITKPSFFSVLTFPEKLGVLLIAPLPFVAATLVLAVGVLVLVGSLTLFSSLVGKGGGPSLPVALAFGLIPALFASALILLLVDNFTYTMFGFGVSTVRSIWRLAYGVLLMLLFAYLVWVFARRVASESRFSLLLSGGLVGLSVAVLALLLLTRDAVFHSDEGATISSVGRRPDVFLISGDALEVERFESYGNPVSENSSFRGMGPNAVAFENHFPNANRTAASTALILTGKYATTTKRHNGARFFSGRDAYEHLPGALRAHGYRAIQIGAGHHVDSFYWGMRLAFDQHNEKSGDASPLDRFSDRLGGRLNWELSFPLLMFERVEVRVRHAFGGPLMEQPHLAARKPGSTIDGQHMVDQLTAFLRANPGPVFAQLHSMSTRHEEPGLEGFDAMVSEIFAELRRQGRFETALIVIWSDHGKNYAMQHRLPLIVKFPREVELPSISANTQTLDIAPTVLDVLDLPITDWMEGRSLLHPLDPYEPIFGIQSQFKTPGLEPDALGEMVEGGVSHLTLIVCDRWYILHLPSTVLGQGKINGHTAPCPAGRLPDEAEAREMIFRHLDERGYGPAYEALVRAR